MASQPAQVETKSLNDSPDIKKLLEDISKHWRIVSGSIEFVINNPERNGFVIFEFTDEEARHTRNLGTRNIIKREDAKDNKDAQESKDVKDSKETKDGKEVKDSQEAKESKEGEDVSEFGHMHYHTHNWSKGSGLKYVVIGHFACGEKKYQRENEREHNSKKLLVYSNIKETPLGMLFLFSSPNQQTDSSNTVMLEPYEDWSHYLSNFQSACSGHFNSFLVDYPGIILSSFGQTRQNNGEDGQQLVFPENTADTKGKIELSHLISGLSKVTLYSLGFNFGFMTPETSHLLFQIFEREGLLSKQESTLFQSLVGYKDLSTEEIKLRKKADELLNAYRKNKQDRKSAGELLNTLDRLNKICFVTKNGEHLYDHLVVVQFVKCLEAIDLSLAIQCYINILKYSVPIYIVQQKKYGTSFYPFHFYSTKRFEALLKRVKPESLTKDNLQKLIRILIEVHEDVYLNFSDEILHYIAVLSGYKAGSLFDETKIEEEFCAFQKHIEKQAVPSATQSSYLNQLSKASNFQFILWSMAKTLRDHAARQISPATTATNSETQTNSESQDNTAYTSTHDEAETTKALQTTSSAVEKKGASEERKQEKESKQTADSNQEITKISMPSSCMLIGKETIESRYGDTAERDMYLLKPNSGRVNQQHPQLDTKDNKDRKDWHEGDWKDLQDIHAETNLKTKQEKLRKFFQEQCSFHNTSCPLIFIIVKDKTSVIITLYFASRKAEKVGKCEPHKELETFEKSYSGLYTPKKSTHFTWGPKDTQFLESIGLKENVAQKGNTQDSQALCDLEYLSYELRQPRPNEAQFLLQSWIPQNFITQAEAEYFLHQSQHAPKPEEAQLLIEAQQAYQKDDFDLLVEKLRTYIKQVLQDNTRRARELQKPYRNVIWLDCNIAFQYAEAIIHKSPSHAKILYSLILGIDDSFNADIRSINIHRSPRYYSLYHNEVLEQYLALSLYQAKNAGEFREIYDLAMDLYRREGSARNLNWVQRILESYCGYPLYALFGKKIPEKGLEAFTHFILKIAEELNNCQLKLQQQQGSRLRQGLTSPMQQERITPKSGQQLLSFSLESNNVRSLDSDDEADPDSTPEGTDNSQAVGTSQAKPVA